MGFPIYTPICIPAYAPVCYVALTALFLPNKISIMLRN